MENEQDGFDYISVTSSWQIKISSLLFRRWPNLKFFGQKQKDVVTVIEIQWEDLSTLPPFFCLEQTSS